MILKYFVDFYDDGEIKGLYKNESECVGCKEYLIKLIPIQRKSTNDVLYTESHKVGDGFKKINTEFGKVINDLKIVSKNLKNISGR